MASHITRRGDRTNPIRTLNSKPLGDDDDASSSKPSQDSISDRNYDVGILSLTWSQCDNGEAGQSGCYE